MLAALDMSPFTFWGAVACVFVSGLVRGFTGFGLTMVLAPSLSIFIGPAGAVVISLILELVTGVPLTPFAARHARVRQVAPLTITACAICPLGSWFLVNADPDLVRRTIAAVVMVLAAVLWSGWRYPGRQTPAASLGVGAVAGILLGGTAIGGPPAILYLMSGSGTPEAIRANIIIHVTVTSVVAILILVIAGVVDGLALMRTYAVTPAAFGAAWLGTLAYRLTQAATARRLVLIFLFCNGLFSLLV